MGGLIILLSRDGLRVEGPEKTTGTVMLMWCNALWPAVFVTYHVHTSKLIHKLATHLPPSSGLTNR